ncbi:hypothetical protein M8J75_000231 [Diaphorina citri]|nr:hypothetical protein M8J75_000231 [Diaphorina citri]
MPIQAPQWTEFLSCPICCNQFDNLARSPISLGCSHTICKHCLANLHRKQCPFDQWNVTLDLDSIPVNFALLQLVGVKVPPPSVPPSLHLSPADAQLYLDCKKCIEDLAIYLKPLSGRLLVQGSNPTSCTLSRPMQRKLIGLINCQILEDEGRGRAIRAARSIGERAVTELNLQHQNPQQLSANLWAAVRARGCQFLGPAMQEEVLKLVLLALEDGSALSRKVLVMFVVQRLEPHFPQASKTSIGHVVQLLYRASCFKVSKREGDSSLMQLKEEFRTYESLRREHDAQIVEIATEAGLRIAPDQWSSLLYGDASRKSHMQSIIDKLQNPQSFAQSVQELVIALQRTGDPGNLANLRGEFERLSSIDPTAELTGFTWAELLGALEATRHVVSGLLDFVSVHGNRRPPGDSNSVLIHSGKYKVSLCRDLTLRGTCPRGVHCTFAHSDEELEKYRNKRHSNRSSATKSDEGGIMNEVTAVTNQMKVHQPGGKHRGYIIPHHTLPPNHFKPPVEYNNNTLTQSMMYTSPPPPLHYVPGVFSPPHPDPAPPQPVLYRTGLQHEDEFVPFESPARNKFGPISRSDLTKTSPGSSSLDPSPSTLANLFLNTKFMAGTQGVPIIGNHTPLYHTGGKSTTSKLFDDSCLPDDFNTAQLDYDLRCFEKDFSRLKLRGSDNNEDDKLLSPQKLSLYEEQDYPRLLGQTSRSWTDDSCCWTSEEYRSDDEESYEVGIANDMRELELRWEVELEEHEKRWSSEEQPVQAKH